MKYASNHKKTVIAMAVVSILSLGVVACGGGDSDGGGVATVPVPETGNAWMRSTIVAEQAAAGSDAAKEAVAQRRAGLLLAAMTPAQKMQQLTGALPEILPELPDCYGARHVTGIAALSIPTFRITNGPVGLGQNDCISPSVYQEVKAGTKSFTAAYTHPSSAKATALPSAISTAASFDPAWQMSSASL